MEDNELIKNIALFIVACIVGIVGYIRKKTPPQDPILTTIGLGWLEREQTERMLRAIDMQANALIRIAETLEELTDRKTNDMADRIDELMAIIERMQAPAPPNVPRRRRR